jgi:alkyl hydroperoxide reductase subunit AhpC
MKKIVSLILGLIILNGSFAQEATHETTNTLKKLPSVQLKDMNGKSINTANLGFNGPVVISFWATWCAPCKRELNTIHELYTDWQEETGVNLVAVSIDDQKTMNSVPVYVNGKGWEYLVLMDPNGDFKRAMGVNNVPHTFLIDTAGNIVFSHNNYAPGDEEELLKEIKKISNTKK